MKRNLLRPVIALTATTVLAGWTAAAAHPPSELPPAGLPATTTAEVVEIGTPIAPVKPVNPNTPVINGSRDVDLAICLDTSGSMDGLIESAKQKLWAIVNDLALAEPAPRLRVALLSFGNDGHSPGSGWVKELTPLTDDLDLVSQQLFALSTNGGTEYVGRVVQTACTSLKWSEDPSAYRMIVVAGNEAATQDPEVSIDSMRATAHGRDIFVNAIYCGNPDDGDAIAWRNVPTETNGSFATIDQNQGTVVIATPFDKAITALGESMNTTYIPIGAAGQQQWVNQTLQDDNARGANSAAAAGRAQTKASALYVCGWDLVDNCALDKDFDIASIKAEDLPENMRSMTMDERVAYVKEMAAKRKSIQEEITTANAQRKAFISDEMQKLGLDESRAFDAMIRDAIRNQASLRGFVFRPSLRAVAAERAEAVRAILTNSGSIEAGCVVTDLVDSAVDKVWADHVVTLTPEALERLNASLAGDENVAASRVMNTDDGAKLVNIDGIIHLVRCGGC